MQAQIVNLSRCNRSSFEPWWPCKRRVRAVLSISDRRVRCQMTRCAPRIKWLSQCFATKVSRTLPRSLPSKQRTWEKWSDRTSYWQPRCGIQWSSSTILRKNSKSKRQNRRWSRRFYRKSMTRWWNSTVQAPLEANISRQGALTSIRLPSTLKQLSTPRAQVTFRKAKSLL